MGKLFFKTILSRPYRVLKNHSTCRLPEEALAMVRFHSFYPLHLAGDYLYLCNEKDRELLKWVKIFNKYDLYSKTDEDPNIDELIPYYQSLIDKYVPGTICW